MTMDKTAAQTARAELRKFVRDEIAADMGDVEALARQLLATRERIEGTAEEEEDLFELANTMLRYARKLGGGVPRPRVVPPPVVAEPEPVTQDEEALAVAAAARAAERENYEAFTPDAWTTLAQARTALTRRIEVEHAARTQARQVHLERVLTLSGIEEPTREQTLELAQHRAWAESLRAVDATRDDKLRDVANLPSLEGARSYAMTVTDWWSA